MPSPRKNAASSGSRREPNLATDLRRCSGKSKDASRPRPVMRADHFDEAGRSALMSRVRRVGTAPELTVRSILHRLGFRFRIADGGLPGRPDIVLPRLRSVIFVHGCFWHHHRGCRRASIPGTRTSYWKEKFRRNQKRDARAKRSLKSLNWRVLVIWECQTRDLDRLRDRLRAFLAVSTGAGCSSA